MKNQTCVIYFVKLFKRKFTFLCKLLHCAKRLYSTYCKLFIKPILHKFDLDIKMLVYKKIHEVAKHELHEIVVNIELNCNLYL